VHSVQDDNSKTQKDAPWSSKLAPPNFILPGGRLRKLVKDYKGAGMKEKGGKGRKSRAGAEPRGFKQLIDYKQRAAQLAPGKQQRASYARASVLSARFAARHAMSSERLLTHGSGPG
jgi:hypothetical protein